ncbi:MAG: hypothetical protein L0241_09770 [Planctomycetia bacterium]|nr:hypothetical protein [Planctomycetia bacterium]
MGKNDRLVVDMSLKTVAAGGTDPREVEKLIKRGVHVFTRKNLHAKCIVADKALVSSSANVSSNSRDHLDEAGLLTTDPGSVQRARDFIDRLCTEPVRPEYLKACKEAYNPPRFAPGAAGKGRQSHIAPAKLWIVNLSAVWLPEAERERYEQSEAKAETRKKQPQSRLDSFHWPYKPRIVDEADLGTWFLQVLTDENSITVFPPGQLRMVDHYIRERKSEKERYVFHLEMPPRCETMTWAQFRRATRSSLGYDSATRPRTRPIKDIEIADAILRLWTPGGRLSRSR